MLVYFYLNISSINNGGGGGGGGGGSIIERPSVPSESERRLE